ncbi:MAG: hypothetical protein KDD45_15555 [Bdellovibrionales bacterium]|nr:hypothetical protein [Bdellovibrionales bacterium]
MLVWGNRFGGNREKPTRFTTTLDNLNEAKVVCPKTYIYYQIKGGKNETPTPGSNS